MIKLILFLIITLLIFQCNIAYATPTIHVSNEICNQQFKLLNETLGPIKPLKTSESSNPSSAAFKIKYPNELKLKVNANKNFIQHMLEDTDRGNKNVLYFDVENSVQKTLNDEIFSEKSVVDSINNSFMHKFYKNLNESPELMSRLSGQYKDYKSLRIRLELKAGDDPKSFEDLLSTIYAKTNSEFANDPELINLVKTIPPRTDRIPDQRSWFLAGMANQALEANMAARSARNSLAGTFPKLSHFRQHIENLSQEVHNIEELRKSLSNQKLLIEKNILEEASDQSIIPSKEMLNILRKIKPSDFSQEEKFIEKIQIQTSHIFGIEIDKKTTSQLALYFKKVDSLSPPMFSEERTVIKLAGAENGIVSVDFAGIGVENIYQQMKTLSLIETKKLDSKQLLELSFSKMQEGINQVTEQMNTAKSVFNSAIEKITPNAPSKTLFSGDDGIYMPKEKNWSESDKSQFVKELSKSNDPSKFRVTFVATEFQNGKSLPEVERSKRIVRAESIEKEIRSKIISADKITPNEAKKFITAIDYQPTERGGVFNLILSGKSFTKNELKLISDSIRSSLKEKDGEILGKIIIN